MARRRLDQTIRTLYSLLEDMLFLKSGTPELVRNTDIEAQLGKMAEQVEFAWIVEAAEPAGRIGDRDAPQSIANTGVGRVCSLAGTIVVLVRNFVTQLIVLAGWLC